MPLQVPPPKDKLPDTTQLETIAFVDSHHTPPPEWANPLVKVKPERLAPLVKYTHRFEWPPSIVVDCGPLMLRRVSGLSSATRFSFTATWIPRFSRYARPPVA